MPSQTEVYGRDYKFGFTDADAPSVNGITGFTARTIATSDTEPEVFQTATNGEGVTEAVAISKPEYRMRTISITGYISPTNFSANAAGNAFNVGSPAKVFFIKKISDPVPKGAFVEVTIDAQNFPLITSTTPN